MRQAVPYVVSHLMASFRQAYANYPCPNIWRQTHHAQDNPAYHKYDWDTEHIHWSLGKFNEADVLFFGSNWVL